MDAVYFGRLLTAMITPFTTDGAIDWPRVKDTMEHLIQTGTETLVVAGTTGESPTLSHEEKVELFRFCADEAKGRVKVIAGTGSNNTAASIELTKEAESTGVDGVMVVAPYYNKPSQEGMIQHFKAVAGATNLPVMVYNVPHRTGVNMATETMLRLAHEVENITSIKEASGDLVQAAQLISRKPEDVAVYSGVDELFIPYLSVGADGIVSVASHLLGSEMKEMMNAFFAGDVKKAAEMQQTYNPLMQAMFMTSSPAPLKYAMALKGICEEHVRLPVIPLNDQQKDIVSTLLEELKV
ncbi:4-hydroxy-tetrahydrodipicolinate synthase [Marinithermofilum abyssi]|uniref:4-hydroxy-tetrahydrodipicolinate synthase n=1 Tax=Marinithermofilum abyssi TaxID=1571185 RepID=UPI001664A70D|nr:4-hydroxy-tetrahydrodipicolinate synthase [Marinithermofilum abyssi]